MIADRTDITSIVKQRHTEQQRNLLPMAKLIAGAAAVTDKLVRTEEWQRYCGYLQGLSEQFKSRKASALQRLGDPNIVKDEEVRKLRQDVFIADITLDTLQFAIELPAAILKGKEEADQFISEFEKKNETSGNAQP